MLFGDWRGHIPRQAEVKGQRRENAPVIFDEGPSHLPATSAHGAVVCLVMSRSTRSIPISKSASESPEANSRAAEVSEQADDPEAILKCFCADVHLISRRSMPA